MFCIYQSDNTNEQIIHIIDTNDIDANECLENIAKFLASEYTENVELDIMDISQEQCQLDVNINNGFYLLRSINENSLNTIQLVEKINVINPGYIYNTTTSTISLLYIWKLCPYNFNNKLNEIGHNNKLVNISQNDKYINHLEKNIIHQPIKYNDTYQYYDLKINKFNVNDIANDSCISIIGKDNLMRACVLNDIVLTITKPQNMTTIIISSEQNANSYQNIFPDAIIELDTYCIEDILLRQSVLINHYKTDIGEFTQNSLPRLCVVLDDFLFSDSNILKNCKAFNELLCNTQQYCITLVIVTQHNMPTNIKVGLNYVLLCPENNESDKKSLYENYVGVLPNSKIFDEVFNKITSNCSCMVMDYTNNTFELSKSIYWYSIC